MGVSEQWTHHRTRNGKIRAALAREHRLYLFPDEPATPDAFRRLISGEARQIDFIGRPRD